MAFSIKNFFSKVKEVTTSWVPYYGGAGTRVSNGNLMENNKNWVYVCTDKIADSVSSVTLKLMQVSKGQDKEIFSHKALDLLNRPNDFLSGRDFRYATVAHEELTGNAYWLKDKPKDPTMMIPLNPQYISPKIDKDTGAIVMYTYRNGAKTVTYSPDLVFHLKYPNPANPNIGRGTLEPIAEWVDVDNYATEFNRRFFMNGATFGGTIETNAATKEAMQLLRVSLNEMYSGVQNAHKPMLMPKGLTMKESTMTQRDMQFSEMDNRFRDKILAAFGVPKSVIGIVEDVNRANAESSNYVFMSFTVKPKLERFITFLNEFYLPAFSGTDNLYFTYTDPTPENVAVEIQENQAGLGNSPWLTVNEVRAKKGLPPVDGGDTVQQLISLAPLGEINSPDLNVEPEPAKGQKRPVRINRKEVAKDNVFDAVANLFKSKAQKDEMEEKHKQFIARVGTYEAKFAKEIKDHDRKQKQEVLDRVKTHVKDLTQAQILNVNDAAAIIIDFATPLMAHLVKDEGTRALLQLNLADSFTMTSRIQKIIDTSVSRMARNYTATTLAKLQTQINAGIAAGEGIDLISNRISSVYDQTEEYRADRVARTEVYSAANDANREAYIQSDVVKTIEWHTAEDEKTCPFCNPLDGKIVDVKENFFDKHETVEGDDGSDYSLNYEKVMNPPLHPNCRCFILPNEISVKAAPKPVEKDGDISEAEFWEGLTKALNENPQ